MLAFLSDGGFGKFIWLIITLIAVVGAMFLVGIEVINNIPINQFLEGIVMAALAHVFTLGGSIVSSNNQTQGAANASLYSASGAASATAAAATTAATNAATAATVDNTAATDANTIATESTIGTH